MGKYPAGVAPVARELASKVFIGLAGAVVAAKLQLVDAHLANRVIGGVGLVRRKKAK